MSNIPDWLPPIILVDGDFDEVLKKLYSIFKRDFVDSQPHYNSMLVWHDRRKKAGEAYEEGFWHLITRDCCKKEDRLFDPRRAERLPWCSPTIDNSSDSLAKTWDYREQRRTKTYIWLEELDYVVLLEIKTLQAQKKGTEVLPPRKIAFLITAYHVDGQSKRRSLRKKYEKRLS